jgi:hypothetical protein
MLEINIKAPFDIAVKNLSSMREVGEGRWSTSRPWPHHDHPTYLPQPATSSVTGYEPTKKWRSPQTFDTQQKGAQRNLYALASPAGPATPDPTCPADRSLAGERCA